jgi:hypothetical protein
VSQLVTQDPYADDFYAQVYGAILRSKMGLQSQDERVLKFGSGGGVGLGLTGPKGGNRRSNAMQRMEQQVERIVNNARRREEEKGMHGGLPVTLQCCRPVITEQHCKAFKVHLAKHLAEATKPLPGSCYKLITTLEPRQRSPLRMATFLKTRDPRARVRKKLPSWAERPSAMLLMCVSSLIIIPCQLMGDGRQPT